MPAADYVDHPRATAIAHESAPDYPKGPVPRDESAAKEPKKPTLTNLYNARPQWLADAHDALDAAVAASYTWTTNIFGEDVLRELLVLNTANF